VLGRLATSGPYSFGRLADPSGFAPRLITAAEVDTASAGRHRHSRSQRAEIDSRHHAPPVCKLLAGIKTRGGGPKSSA
jgi:hypothetical protein